MHTKQAVMNAVTTSKWSTALETDILERQHGEDPESHQIRCDNQHCIPPELILVTKIVPKEVLNDCVVAIKTLHIVVPIAKLVHSKGIENPSRRGASVEPLPASWDAGVWQHEAIEDLEDQVQGCTSAEIAVSCQSF